MTMFKKLAAAAALAFGVLVVLAPAALACGGLVAPDGDVHLDRAATLIAWHDGIEHYMTSFAYQGNESSVGWITPLPAVPLSIQEGGAWTLQRLSREVHPQRVDEAAPTSNAAGGVDVLQQVQIEALNITVVRGSGPAIVGWAKSNGFYVSDETAAHLAMYAQGSPIFMAAKYDTSAAQKRGQLAGDGVPILVTMKTAHPWVPLEVLALDGQEVHADLYFLTDMPLNTSDANAVIGESAVGSQVPNAPGMTVAFQEEMNASLYHDLSTDRNMGWVRSDGWLTYVSLDAGEGAVTYDLGVTPRGVIRLAPFGTPPMAVVDNTPDSVPSWLPNLPLGTPQVALVILIVLGLIGGAFFALRRQRRAQNLKQTPAKTLD